MFKKLYSLILMLSIWGIAHAQIMLTPYIDSTSGGLDENNVSVLEGNLRSMISRAGLESSYGGRFILAVKVSLLDKSMTATAPVKVVQKVMMTYAIGDSQSGTCFGTTTMELRGVGETDIQATLSCFRNLKLSPELKNLIAQSRDHIIEYYDSNGASILAHAKSLVTGQKYEEALYELSFIPSECKIYPEIAAYMSDIYQTNINHDAAQILAQAQAVWSSDPNPGPAADEATKLLGQIDTNAACYAQAQTLLKTIHNRVQSVTDQRYADEVAYKNAQLKATTTLEKARIKACRDVAVAYAQSRPRVIYNVHTWW